MAKKNKNVTTNEFNQVVEGTSLTKEAWKRLKKNKMAIFGLVVVCIYALVAAFADFLPLYPYYEQVIDHKQLRPSLTKTAGELMMEKQMQDIYYKAWRAGRLQITDEETQMVKAWIAEDQTTKVWNFLAEEGERQLEAKTFEFSESDLKTINKYQEKISSDIMVSISDMYADVDGKMVNLEKMDYLELEEIYSKINNGLSVEQINAAIRKELISAQVNTIRSTDTEISQADAQAQAEIDIENYSEKEYANLAKDNILGKIETQIKKSALSQIKAEVKSNPDISFPIKEKITLDSGIIVKLEASRTNDRRYILGTDSLGRDLLSRIIYGGRVSIAIGLIGTITSVIIGILVGSIAGYKGGKVDYYLMRFVDVMYGLPYMLLVIICMAVFGRGLFNLFFALALISWLTIARMVRGQIMSLKNQEYVEAARSMGASTTRIITRHMIPNSLSIIIVYSTIRIPNFIMQESFLSFLGLGVQAPFASWGSLIGDAVASMTVYPWLLIYPSLAMVIFLFAMNFFGDGLRDAFDPQSKNQL